MSYILDALRKSEQERLRGQPLASLRQQTTSSQIAQRPRWLLALLAGNLALLTILAVWWIRSASTADPGPGAPQIVDQALAAGPDVAVVEPAAAVPKPQPAAMVATDDTPDAQPTEGNEEYAPALGNADYERAGDWQADTADLPPLALSTHVYSSSPAARNVIINGVRLREGDELANGVVIEEINEAGALVSFRGTEHQLDIGR